MNEHRTRWPIGMTLDAMLSAIEAGDSFEVSGIIADRYIRDLIAYLQAPNLERNLAHKR